VLQVLKTECYDEFGSQSGSEALGIVVSIAAFKAVNPGSIPGRRSSVLQVLKTESYHEFESHSVSEMLWYSGEHSCLQSRYPGFDSRPMQFCVIGSEDRVLS
jgi:hypothetical protein